MADIGSFEDFWNQSESQTEEASTKDALEVGERIEKKFEEHGANKRNYYEEQQHG